jgi:exodeoxyribonuclease (lambda-induced)
MDTVIKQRSTEWRLQRLGMVTASRFKDVLTQPRTKKDKESGVMSATAQAYLHDCLAERLIGQPLDRFKSQPTDWGNEWEATALEAACGEVKERDGLEIELPEGKYAFMTHQTEDFIGCSPDGVCTDNTTLVEIKCPWRPSVHLDTVLNGWMPEKHKAQVQGSLWITGRQSYVFISYDPRYRGTPLQDLFVVRVPRDDEYIDTVLAPAVVAFRDELQATYDRIVAAYKQTSGEPF